MVSAATSSFSALRPFSSLQKLLSDPSNASATHAAHLQSLALQIQHNLQHQHSWTAIRIHTHSPDTEKLLSRPLVSGLPPTRLYVHPDEQIELLKEADRQRKSRARNAEVSTDEGADGVAKTKQEGLQVKTQPEREWVLPTRLDEKWTLRRLTELFDGISIVPPHLGEQEADADSGGNNKWRTTKRLVLASVDEDSTVVYYIIHDGIVKPRQN